jgi:hypothetical protein
MCLTHNLCTMHNDVNGIRAPIAKDSKARNYGGRDDVRVCRHLLLLAID